MRWGRWGASAARRFTPACASMRFQRMPGGMPSHVVLHSPTPRQAAVLASHIPSPPPALQAHLQLATLVDLPLPFLPLNSRSPPPPSSFLLLFLPLPSPSLPFSGPPAASPRLPHQPRRGRRPRPGQPTTRSAWRGHRERRQVPAALPPAAQVREGGRSRGGGAWGNCMG